MSDSCCGASNCCANSGGYQLHTTFQNQANIDLEELKGQFEMHDTEIVFIKNYLSYPDKYYEELITSTNFKDPKDAFMFMYILNLHLHQLGAKVLRYKVEANPQIYAGFLYIETHFKISKETAEKIKGKILLSENSKGTLFATVRYNSRDQLAEPDFEYISKMSELVIFDSNTALDSNWEASLS